MLLHLRQHTNHQGCTRHLNITPRRRMGTRANHSMRHTVNHPRISHPPSTVNHHHTSHQQGMVIPRRISQPLSMVSRHHTTAMVTDISNHHNSHRPTAASTRHTCLPRRVNILPRPRISHKGLLMCHMGRILMAATRLIRGLAVMSSLGGGLRVGLATGLDGF